MQTTLMSSQKSYAANFQPDLNVSYLTNSTTWKSIVRHPASLKDKSLFVQTPSKNYKEPTTFFDKILSFVGLGNFDTTKDISLTHEVMAMLPGFDIIQRK